MQISKVFILLFLFLSACADSGTHSASNSTPSTDTQLPDDTDTDVLPNDDSEFQNSAKITVMTYNINAIPCARKNFLSGFLGLFGVDRCPTDTWHSKNIDDRMEKLTNFIAALDKADKLPDVLLVQEAFRAKIFQVDDDAINKLIDKSPYKHIVNGPEARIDNAPDDILKSLWNQDGLLNSGVIIFSKYPINKTDTVRFGKLCARGLCNAEKGVVYAQIKLPNVPKPIDFFNTHHQSFTEEENIRKKQNELMFDFMQKNENSPWAIAGGDFNFKNTDAYETFKQFVKGSKMDHAGLACLDNKECTIAKDTKKKSVQGDVLDHQFFASSSDKYDIAPTRVEFDTIMMGKNKLSDHDYHTVEYTLYW